MWLRRAGHEQATADHLLGVNQAVREVAVRRALHSGEAIRREDRPLRREARVHDGRDLHADRRVLGDLAATARLVARLLQLGVQREGRAEARPRIGVQVLDGRPEAGKSPELEEQVHVRATLGPLRRAGDRGRTGDVQLGKLSRPLLGKGFSAAVAETG